jgi:hypothetical protein
LDISVTNHAADIKIRKDTISSILDAPQNQELMIEPNDESVEVLTWKRSTSARAQGVVPNGKGPFLVQLSILNFLMTEGEGDPNGFQRFPEAIETLYGLAYGITFAG